MSSSMDRLMNRAKATGAIPGEREIEVPLDKIRFDAKQPRRAFHSLDGQVPKDAEEYIEELAGTIKAQGLIQAITVQEMPDGTYMVVIGENRTRAHMKLGLVTIRAKVRNDLTNRAQRLIYQITENVTRKDLTDHELALSIRDLMQGGEGVEPMSQTEIATMLSKSEGWVTRFVKFGDEELQRLWVKTGIADTVEKVYRLSTLPVSAQVDIQRRVELPEGHRDRLEKPLNRNVIDELLREAKRSKLSPTAAATQSYAPEAAVGMAPGPAPLAGATVLTTASGVAVHDTVGQAFAQAAAAGQAPGPSAPPASTQSPAKYTLDPNARAALIGSAASAVNSGAGAQTQATREQQQAPVNCRVTVASLLALIERIKTNDKLNTALERVQCDLLVPGAVAQLIANDLTGIVVDHREVPATLHTALAKLQ